MARKKARSEQKFDADISTLRGRLEAIANDTNLSDKERLDILFHDLGVSLEELEVTHEELLAANEEMLEARGQVEAERQRYLDLFERAPDGYVVTDDKGTIIEANAAAAALLNVRSDALSGKPLVLFITAPGKKEFHSGITRLFSGETTEMREWGLMLQPRDRAPLPVLLTVSAVRRKEGETTRLLWLLRDITERTASLEALALQKTILDERVKELHCLYDIARVIEKNAPLEEILRGIVAQIPAGWKYPHSACARIRVGDIECSTPNFMETWWRLSSAIHAQGKQAGTVEVCYRSEKPDEYEGPFLLEERHLLDTIAQRIGRVTERIQAEEALRQSEERLAAVLENLPVGIWIVDSMGRVTAKNKAADLIWRGDAPLSSCPEEYVDYIAWDVETGKQMEADDYPLTRALRTGLPTTPVELRIRRFDGTEGFIIMSTALLRGPDGLLTGAVGINVDITERKQMEEALRESNARKQLLVDNLSEGIWFIDDHAVITFVNQQMAQMLGYQAGEMIGMSLGDLLPEEGRAVIREYLERKKQGIREKEEQTFLHKDGSHLHTLMISSPMYDENGGFTGAIAGVSDISDRKKMEMELFESRERLNLAIGGARLGVWDKDLVTGEVITEAHWGLLLGYEPGDPIPPWQEQVHPDDRNVTLEKIRDHLRGKTPYAEASYRMKTKDGRYVWILTRGRVVAYDVRGNPRRLTGVDQNITALRTTQEALRDANTKLNLLSSITRHDILNQVMGLKGFLYLLEERQGEDPESAEMVAKLNLITDSIHRLIAFTGDYQHMGERNPIWQRVTAVAKRAAKSVMLGEATFTVSTGSLEVFADPMLEKAFYNLLDNAMTHGGHVTAIRVSCTLQGEDCTIAVEDNGTGIPASMKDAIFERGIGKNTGFGLFLTKEILGITGMTIRENGEEGKGARFEIAVPADRWRMGGSR